MNELEIKTVALSENDFHKLREIIDRESGINLNTSKKMLVQARLMKRMRELGIDDYSVYIEYLHDNYNDEIINLINCITTNKTEFFREAFHFTFLKNTVFPDFEERRLRKLRIWSAGCSTGEEPYTIAISLLDYFGDDVSWDIKILATDIDTSVLEKAGEGVYSEECVKCIEPAMLKKYFLRGTGPSAGYYRVKDSLKQLISFRRLNLLSDHFPMKGSFDIIFCRNVVIYFDRESQQKLFAQFNKYLDPQGYLFMGHSEALTYVSGLFNLIGRSVYRKNTPCT